MRDDKRVQENDELDSRIDAALRSYVEPPQMTEPRIILARIMERAQIERSARPMRSWFWGAAAAAACLVAVAAALWLLQAHPAPKIAWAPAAPGVETLPSVARSQAPAIRRSTHARPVSTSREVAARSAALPKLDVFPTPRPLSPEEQALVSFAKQGPAAVQRAVLQDQKHWDEVTALSSLQMPPQAAHQQDQ